MTDEELKRLREQLENATPQAPHDSPICPRCHNKWTPDPEMDIPDHQHCWPCASTALDDALLTFELLLSEVERLRGCMRAAGLACFIRDGSEEQVAEHLRGVAASWVGIEAERDEARRIARDFRRYAPRHNTSDPEFPCLCDACDPPDWLVKP